MKQFKRAYIEITNVCNLSCPFCPGTNRTKTFMSQDLFQEILLKLKGHCEYLYFHVMGEPLLHPHIDEYLDLAHRDGYKVNLVTNGSLISQVGDKIAGKPALRQISFSLHSLEHFPLAVVDHTLNDIFAFITKARSTRELLISLRLWNFSEQGNNPNNQYVLDRIAEEYGLVDDLGQQLAGNSQRGIKLAEGLFLNPAHQFQWPDINLAPLPGPAFCYGLKEQLAILVDGTVVPCCLDSEGNISLGNIREKSLPEILDSPRVHAFQTGFARREAAEELCQRCGYRTRFTLTKGLGDF